MPAAANSRANMLISKARRIRCSPVNALCTRSCTLRADGLLSDTGMTRMLACAIHTLTTLHDASSPTILLVLLVNVWVGHASNVVADNAGQRFGFCLLPVAGGKLFGMLHPELKQIGDDALGGFLFRFERR